MAQVPGADALRKALFSGERSVSGLFFLALILGGADFIFRSGLGLGQTADPGINVLLFTLYVLLALLAAFGALRTSDSTQNIKNFFLVFLPMSLIVFFAPALAGFLFGKFPTITGNFVFGLLSLILTQLWIFILGFMFEDRLWVFFRILFWIYVIFLLISAIYQNQQFIAKIGEAKLGGQGIGTNQFLVDTYTKTSTTAYNLWKYGKATGGQVAQAANQTLNYASGDYYTGQVDKKAVIPNKIDIKDLKPTQPQFRDVDPISVFATLTTETIDITPAPVAQLQCSASTDGGTGTKKSIDATPSPEKVTLGPYDSWDVSCTFPADTFKKTGTRQALVNMSATFDFSTQAYLKTYWMDKSRLLDLRKSNQDPLQVYSITDKNPITIYTSGPLKVGMRISSQTVQGIDRNAETTLSLGVTFDNSWQGSVLKLSNIVIFVPKGMRIDGVVGQATPPRQINCQDDAIIKSGQVEACDDLINNIYTLVPQNVDLSKFLTLLFNVKIGAGDYDRILGTSPITTRYFKTTAAYTYRLERVLTIPITTTTQDVVQSGSTDQTPATIVGNPRVSLGANQATIDYETNQPTKDKITYYSSDVPFTDVFETGYASKNESTSHSVQISGLTPGSIYQYKIISVNKAGIRATNQNAEYTFTAQ